MSPTNLPAARDRGFTLIELLLAMALVAMIIAAAYGSLRAATRAVDRGQDTLQQAGHVRAANQFVRRQLGHALPLTYAVDDAEGGVRTVFEGSGGSVQFVGIMPGYLGYGGPQVQRIELAPYEDGMALWFMHAPIQSYALDGAWLGDPVLLLENVADARFYFLGRDQQGELTGWVNQWDTPEYVPVSVSLEVDLAEGQKMGWPLLVANIRLDEESISAAQGGNESYEQAIRALIRGDRPRNPDAEN